MYRGSTNVAAYRKVKVRMTGNSAIENALDPAAPSQNLQRRLTERQLAMIAIGGAIGVGLFLGSTVTINVAGPGVIITYLLGAVLSLIMAYSLAEMAVGHPGGGSFGDFGEDYPRPWVGFTLRATHWLIQVVA